MTKPTHLSDIHQMIDAEAVKNASVAIVVSEWNKEITSRLLQGALEELRTYTQNFYVEWVPGSYELPQGAQFFIEYRHPDAVICLGCLIQGETRHFEFIAQAVANHIEAVALKYNTPVIFGVLTTDTYEQALERSGGQKGNKGIEAARAALQMIAMKKRLLQST